MLESISWNPRADDSAERHKMCTNGIPACIFGRGEDGLKVGRKGSEGIGIRYRWLALCVCDMTSPSLLFAQADVFVENS